jgi:hypothetical protein
MLAPTPIKDEVHLTFEDIEQIEEYKNLQEEEKSEVIATVYELSLAIYNLHFQINKRSEKQ